MIDRIKKAFSPSDFNGVEDKFLKNEVMRCPVMADLPLRLPKADPRDVRSRKRILKAFQKVSKKSNCHLAVMQNLFDKRHSWMLKALIQPIK